MNPLYYTTSILIENLIVSLKNMIFLCPSDSVILLHFPPKFTEMEHCDTIIRGYPAKRPYPPCLRMADRALLAGYPRIVLTKLLKVLCSFGEILYWCNKLWQHMTQALHDYHAVLHSARISNWFTATSQACSGISHLGPLFTNMDR